MPRPGGPTWSVLLLSFSATVLTTLQSTDQGVSREASYAWTEQLVKMDATPVTNFTAEEKKVLEENHIPESLWPFVNVTAVESLNDKRNRSEDNVITDEDVADVLDDDGNSPKPNTMHYDGKKTTITISTEGGEMLFQHWLDQALSGLLATVATNKLKNVGEVERAAHKECAKDSTTLKKHAQCVVALLDAEAKYQRWLKHPRNTARNSGTTHISPYRASRPRKRKWKSLFGKKPRFTARKTGHPWRKNSSFSQVRTPSRRRWVGAFGMRAKRSVDDGATMNVKPVAMDRYDLIEEHRNSPLAVIANNLLREVRRLKKKDDHEVDDWRKVIAEIKEEGSKLKKKRKAQKLLKERISMFRKTLRENGASQDTMKATEAFFCILGPEFKIYWPNCSILFNIQPQAVRKAR